MHGNAIKNSWYIPLEEDLKPEMISVDSNASRHITIVPYSTIWEILGAYGCGVFLNPPEAVAGWWKELLEEGYQDFFESICFAIFDRSEKKECLNAFQKYFQS